MNSKQLDKAIEAEYYRQANGRQINIMDIPKLFDSARELVKGGKSVPAAVEIVVGMYCKEVSHG